MIKYLYLIALLILTGCQSTSINFDQIDLNQWKADKFGCLSYRAGKIDELQSSKSTLLRLSEKEIIEAIGKPDREELQERSQKMYLYYLQAAHCNSSNITSNAIVKVFQVRFNAMGYCNNSIISQERIKE